MRCCGLRAPHGSAAAEPARLGAVPEALLPLAALCAPGQIAPARPGWPNVSSSGDGLCSEPGTSSESWGEGAVVVVNMGCVSCTQMRRRKYPMGRYCSRGRAALPALLCSLQIKTRQPVRGKALYSLSDCREGEGKARSQLHSGKRASCCGTSVLGRVHSTHHFTLANNCLFMGWSYRALQFSM